MRKVEIKFTINVPNNFYCGNCKNCPMKSETYYDGHIEVKCGLGFNEGTCPIYYEGDKD